MTAEDWREELYQLLVGHLSDGEFDEGVREMAAIGAHHPETHEKYLVAIQAGYDAALSGDPSVLDVLDRGNSRYVPDLPSAVAFLEELRDAYLERVKIAKEIAAIFVDWKSGELARWAVDNRIFELLTPTNIDEVVAATSGEWQRRLVEHLRGIAENEGGPPFSVFGGIYMYEVEQDPVRRAEMKAEIEREEDARAARFEETMGPAIRAWARRRGPSP
jgi:hypothetical protein